MFRKLVLSVLVFATNFFMGCGPINDVSAMRQQMGHLSDQTDAVSRETETLSRQIGSLAGDTADLRDKASEAYTYESRHLALDELVSAKTQTAKLKAAAIYIVTFEFQAWNAFGNDSQETLDEEMLVAAQEFFRGVTEYMAPPNDRKTSPTATDQRSMNLYALAVTLQEISMDQRIMIHRTGRKTISMLTMIEDSLNDNYQNVRTGRKPASSLPAWENETLTHYPDIVYLLRVRANFLMGMFLAQVSDIEKTGFLGIPGLFNRLRMLTHKWDSQLSGLNDSTLDNITTFLHGSNESRAFLESIGEPLVMDKNLIKILANMKIPDESVATPQRSALMANLTGELAVALGTGGRP